MAEFKQGDVVQLKSGGPDMTCTGEKSENGDVWCQWFAGEKVNKDCFPPDSLKLVEEHEMPGETT